MRLLLPWGFYGSGNIGDDATLQGFGRLVAQAKGSHSVWAASRNPRHSARVEPSFRYFRHPYAGLKRHWLHVRTRAVVLAGGTPIMDCHGDWPLSEVAPLVETAHRRGQPIAFVGSGTERLERDASRRIIANRLAPIVCSWTVRSEPDEARLIEYGVPAQRVRVAGDMAWLLEPVTADWGRRRLDSWGVKPTRRLVGVNVMDEEPVLDRHPHVLQAVAFWLDSILDTHDATVLFLANDVHERAGFDRSAALQIRAAMKHHARTLLIPKEYFAPQEMMSLIANCDATVSMRYHFCLFSAIQRVPFIALQRSDKVADLCWDLRWPWGSDLTNLNPIRLRDLFDTLQSQRADAVSRLSARVPVLEKRALTNTIGLDALHAEVA